MKRRIFLKAVGGGLTAVMVPALPGVYAEPVVTMLPRPRTYTVPRNNEWLLDAVFDNLQNQPPYDGTFHLSLHSGKFKINGWDADKVSAIIFRDVPGGGPKRPQCETKLLPDRQ